MTNDTSPAAFDSCIINRLVNFMPASLLATKLHFPQVRSNSVPRPRLIKILERGLQGPLTLISAPAGSGKTTLMGEWRARPECKIPIVWLSLDSADNDPLRFLTYLTASIESASPMLTHSIAPLFQSPQPPPPEIIIISLLEALSALTGDLILALDDYHVITNITVHETLNRILEYSPSNFHLVILTRADPPLPLARLRVRNQLTEIRAHDLRFTVDEVSAFLSQTMCLMLSQEQISTLEAHTEGWIAGLQLAALSMQGRGDVDEFVATFTGSHHFVLDYLVEEVLSLQSEKTRDFLLRTSILERMNAPLCNALTGANDGQSMLEELERSNLFVVGLDNERVWYRYHHLFADVLHAHLDRSQAERVPELQRRASEWYAHQGMMEDAIAYSLKAQDFDRAAGLIEQYAPSVSMQGRVATLSKWIGALPEHVIINRPKLGLVEVWALYFEYKFDETEKYLYRIVQNLSAENAQLFNAEISLWHGILARRHGKIDESQSFLLQALGQLPEIGSPLRGRASIFLGLDFLENDIPRAQQAFLQAQASYETEKNTQGLLAALYFLTWTQVMQGLLVPASFTCQRALGLVTQAPQWPVASYAHLAMAELLYEQNDLIAAADHLKKATELTEYSGHSDNLFIATLDAARVQRANRNWGEAQNLIERAEQLAHSTIPSVMAQVIAERVYLFLLQGKICEAAEVLRHDQTCSHATSLLPRAIGKITRARCHLVQHQPDDASAQLTGLLEEVEKAGMSRLQIQIQCIQSVILDAHGHTEDALRVFKQALSFAQEMGFFRTVLDEEPLISKLLHQVKAECGELKIYARKLLAASGATPALHPSMPPSELLIDPLSGRELEVLRMIASGAPNKKIAHDLVIAIGTVKRHTVNIFNKLGVENRTEAVAKAREMEIL
jgi:LuxR family maltose regulon positive regulatory protein